MKKYKMIPILAISVMLMISGCGASNETTEAETEQITIETETEAETEITVETNAEAPELKEGMMYSRLTGLPVSEEVGLQRPYAIMINNIEASLPQSGIIYADIIYEAQVEGGITRLMALYQDVDDVEKIGSIRSARHYYIDFANDNDAIYVHYGQSKYAQERIDSENIITIHGISGYEAQVFYRSTDREAPHNVYTTGEMLAKGLEITGLSREYPDDYENRLIFNYEDTVPADGESATTIKIPFDSKPVFKYNADDGLYYRRQYGKKHIDRETKEQLSFKNVIVQYVGEKSISDEDHQDLAVNGTGKGIYFTDGVAIPITWERTTANDKTRYYDADGNQISLNPGKTFIEVISKKKTVKYK